MYTPQTIQDEFFGATPLVGWRQEQDPALGELDSTLITSTSNRFFQDQHPLLTLKNIFSIAPAFEDFVYNIWVIGTPYVIGNIVLGSNSSNYIALTDNVGIDPISNPIDWELWTNDNAKSKWLKEKTRGYILNVMDDYLEQKQWNKTAKSIIENRALFDGSQYADEVTESQGKTAAFELRTASNMGVLARLNRIGLQFTEAGTIDINIYHTSQLAPVFSQTFTITTAKSTQWFDLNFDMPYLSSFDADGRGGVGGSWTIEYNQSNVSGNAVNKAKDWSAAPMYRNGYEFKSWKLWSQFLEVHPFTVPTSNRDDPSKRTYEYTSNFGMNLEVSVFCDYSDFFIRQKQLFSNAISKGVAVKFLKELSINANARVNLGESNINIQKPDIDFEIHGNPQGRKMGLAHEYYQSLEALKIDTNGLSKYCLPCGRKGIKFKSV